jgi:hypothetical protein
LSERQYISFTPKENNTDMTISADHINEIQEAVEKTQEELFYQADVAFLNKSLFALEHHPDTNSMIVDLLEDSSRIDVPTMTHVSYVEETDSVSFNHPTALEGEFTTRAIINETKMPIRKVVLLVDEYVPEGSQIQYEISYDNVNYYPITANYAIPKEVEGELGQIYLRIKFKRLTPDVFPRLDAWAIMYEDATYAFKYLDDGINLGIETGWDGTIIK